MLPLVLAQVYLAEKHRLYVTFSALEEANFL
jgi:hypothetical protein